MPYGGYLGQIKGVRSRHGDILAIKTKAFSCRNLTSLQEMSPCRDLTPFLYFFFTIFEKCLIISTYYKIYSNTYYLTMAKYPEKEIRKLTVTGSTGTYYVTIPKWMIRDLKWRRGQRIMVTQRGERLILEALK